MSGCSYDNGCPRCGSPNLKCSSDWKPYDCVAGECLDCGFEFHTQEGQMTLEQVNERRTDYDMEPIKQLWQPTKEWAAARA